jgi:hypothetical protein
MHFTFFCKDSKIYGGCLWQKKAHGFDVIPTILTKFVKHGSNPNGKRYSLAQFQLPLDFVITKF